jgi:hypothetical protein
LATYYVRGTNGNDANSGADWSNAKRTIAGALAVALTTGDIIYVDSGESYTSGGAITHSVATTGIHVAILSVNRGGSTTTGHSGWQVGAKETVGVSGNSFVIGSTRSSLMYYYGVYFEGNSGVSSFNYVNFSQPSSGGTVITLKNCTISTPGTSSNNGIIFGTMGTQRQMLKIACYDCTFRLVDAAASTRGISFICVDALLVNATIVFNGANKPAVLFGVTSGIIGKQEASIVNVIDSDLSGYNASGNLIDVTDFDGGSITIVNCKLSSTPSILTGTWPINSQASVTLVNTDSIDSKVRFRYQTRLGTIDQSTSVYANSGATHDGTNVSWQITTTSNCSEAEPFICPWIEKWNASTSAQTLTLEIAHNEGASYLTDRNCWMEYEYVSNASFPQGTLGSTRNAQPFDATAVALGAGAATWTAPGTEATVKQKTSATFTAAEESLLRVRPVFAVASKVFYVDPNDRLA